MTMAIYPRCMDEGGSGLLGLHQVEGHDDIYSCERHGKMAIMEVVFALAKRRIRNSVEPDQQS